MLLLLTTFRWFWKVRLFLIVVLFFNIAVFGLILTGTLFTYPILMVFFVPDGTSLRWNDDLLTTVVCDSGLVGRTLVGDGFKFVILSIDYGWSWHPSQQVYLLLYGFGAAMSLHFGLIGMSFVVRAFKGGAYAVLR